MSPFSFFNLKDLVFSVTLGILVGWLLISIHEPAHKRFQFELSQTHNLSETRSLV